MEEDDSMHTRNRTNAAPQKGFTLLELLVVVVIIGLLTSIVGPKLMAHIGRSERTAAKAQLDAFDKALQAYRVDMGRYPSSSEGLKALVQRPAGDNRWNGPYLAGEVPMDPWGRAYEYRDANSPGKDFLIRSLGRDGAVGGSGDDADIGN